MRAHTRNLINGAHSLLYTVFDSARDAHHAGRVEFTLRGSKQWVKAYEKWHRAYMKECDLAHKESRGLR